MALTITITPPSAPLTLDSVVESAGTSDLTAGSYEFGIICLTGNSGYSYPPFLRTPISNTIIKVLSGGENITFNYSNVPADAYQIMPVFRKDGGKWLAGYFHWIYISTYPSSVTIGDSSITQFDLSTTYWTFIENFEITGRGLYNLDLTKGIGKININTDQDFYLSDIITALDNSVDAIENEDYITNDNRHLVTTYGIYLEGTGRFVMSGIYLMPVGGFNNRYGTVTLYSRVNVMGPAQLVCPIRGGYFTWGYIDNADLEHFVISGGWDNDEAGGAVSFGGGSIKYSYVHQRYGLLAKSATDSVLINTNTARLWQDYEFYRITLVASSVYPACSYNDRARECTFIVGENYIYQIFWLPNHATNSIKFTDCLFKGQGNDLPILPQDMKYSDWNKYNMEGRIQFWNTLALTIKDSSGNPIAGAAIKVADSQNNEYNYITDENGQIAEEIIGFEHRNINGNPAEVTTGTGPNNTKYTPFVLSVSKVGYDSYVEAEIETTEKIEKTIALVEKTYIDRTIEGAVEMVGVQGEITDQNINGEISSVDIGGEITVLTL